MKTILLTGATGFLGSHLLKRFLDDGYSLVIIKRSFSLHWRINFLINAVTVYDMDKIDDLEVIFKEHSIYGVIHCATCYDRDDSQPLEVLSSNLLMPVELIKLAAKYKTKFFINTDTFTKPGYGKLKHYSLSKKQLKEWLKLYSKKVTVVNLLLHHLYGEMDHHSKFIPFIIKKILSASRSVDLTAGEQKRDFIYINDAVRAFKAVVDNYQQLKGGYNEYEVGTGQSVALKELVQTVKKLVGNKKIKLNFGALPYVSNEIMEEKADVMKIRKELGWKSIISLEEGLKKTIEWYKKHGEFNE